MAYCLGCLLEMASIAAWTANSTLPESLMRRPAMGVSLTVAVPEASAAIVEELGALGNAAGSD